MEQKTDNSTEQDLIEQLKSLPLQQVPTGLTERVMARVASRKPTKIGAIWQYISRSQSISIKPVYVFGVALLVCGAFFLSKNYQQPSPLAQIQSEMLEDPRSAYLVGRGLLRVDNNPAQALPFLQRAALLEPGNPEFAYWEGIGYWASGDNEKERSSYLRGLEVDPADIPLLINLGHSYLSDKKYHEALNTYQEVLALSPDESVALYNSGLAYRALGMISEEKYAWRSFLHANRTGSQAFRAVQRLNEYGDFSFRIYPVGWHKVIINQQALLDETLSVKKRQEELVPITSILEMDERLNLEVVVFWEHDYEAARKRALQLKSMIVENSTQNLGKQVKLSWFDSPETIQKSDNASGVMLSEGLLLFGHLTTESEREITI